LRRLPSNRLEALPRIALRQSFALYRVEALIFLVMSRLAGLDSARLETLPRFAWPEALPRLASPRLGLPRELATPCLEASRSLALPSRFHLA
jgi:hypothetical protein